LATPQYLFYLYIFPSIYLIERKPGEF